MAQLCHMQEFVRAAGTIEQFSLKNHKPTCRDALLKSIVTD
jgi:hypothetical protein